MKSTMTIAITLGALVGIGGRLALRGDAAPRASAGDANSSGQISLVCANGLVEGARPKVELRPEVMGRLFALAVDAGDSVQQGQVLAELENGTQKARLEQARADLQMAREQLRRVLNGEREQARSAARAETAAREVAYRLAEKDLNRLLNARSGVSAGDLDQAKARAEQTKQEWERSKANLDLILAPAREEDKAEFEARVLVAEAKVREAEGELEKTRVRSPLNGVVLERHGEPGAMAYPNAGPLLVVADLSRRRIRAYIEELDEARVAPNQEVTVTADSRPGKEYSGRVASVLPGMVKGGMPTTDAPTEMRDMHHREVLLDMAEGCDLPPGLLVQVRIRVLEREEP